jgi:hypothetical protein
LSQERKLVGIWHVCDVPHGISASL